MKKQNEILNAVKGIACIAVVFMHCEFPGLLGTIVQALTRFCVPFFFMISGYYCFYSDEVDTYEKMPAKLKHIGMITLNSTLFYLAVAYLWGASFKITMGGVISWVVFNSPLIVVGQLWFLFALLYDYLFFTLVCKTKTQRLVMFLTPLLFIAYISLAQGAHLGGLHLPNMIYRNWLIEGLAYFMAGYWIHKNQSRLCFSNNTLLAVFITSTLLCLLERYLMGRDFGVNICTIPQVLTLFLLAVNNQSDKETWLSKLGKRYSMYVYILHPFVWHVLERIYARIGVSESIVALYLLPLLVVAGTLLMSHMVFVCNNKLKMKLQHA